jgi:cytochrome c peroxidase
MNSRLFPALGLCALLIIMSCQQDSEIAEDIPASLDKQLMDALISASPNGRFFHFILADENKLEFLPNQEAANPITKEKVRLGKFLFFDTGLAQDAIDSSCYETYSCATCHIPESGFLPGRKQGIADGAHGFGYRGSVREQLNFYSEADLDAQGVRPLSVLNVAYMTNTLWSGLFGATHVNEGTEALWEGPLAEVNHNGYIGLESQNIEGVKLHRMSLNQHVLDDFGYRALFDDAFPEVPEEERYSDETISFALGAYLRTILTTQAPFQKYLRGDRASMSDNQKKGALLFFGKARCFRCHNSPALSGMTFHALGTKDLYAQGGLNTSESDPRNLGRGLFTKNADDYYQFKVPQLYNLKDYKTFFHGSSKETLEEVLAFKIKAQSENEQVAQDKLSPIFQPLDLNQEEQQSILDFLTDALYDPGYSRFVPSTLPSGHCFPNNDARSKAELGCQ